MIHFFRRNLFLGYYLPFRHLVPLWEMENDYYLHNFHSSGFQKDSDMCHESVTSMKTYERAYGLTWREDEELADLDVDTSKISHPRNGSKSSHPCTIPTFSWDTESSRVKRVRNKCEAQNTALSLWWKLALQSHIEDRLWVRLGKAQDESVLPGRYERVYQPDKLSQFDRFFSRTWETPVRRSHAAQHYETGDDDEAAVVFSRVLSSELTFPSVTKASKHLHQNVESGGTLKEFTTDFGFSPHQAVTYAPMFAHQFKNTSTPSGIDYLNRSNTKSPPEEYVRYCSPYKHAASNRAEVFKREMHDYSLSADDVTGIREVSSFNCSVHSGELYRHMLTILFAQLARRAHLSATIADGEYRCLHMSTSSIYFASIVQEQLNTLESLSSVGLTTVDEELECPALHTIGMKESVTSRWESFKDTERQYAQVVKDINPVCQRSALSTADALQLYISQFDEETILSKPDRIFLRPLERFHEKLKHERLDVRLKQQSTFVEKAGRLGIHITPHEIREAAVPPPLYHSDRRDEVSVGFEQINEDMFSRSDNKFMVFNSAGVDSWSGTTPVTKISHVEDIIRSTIV